MLACYQNRSGLGLMPSHRLANRENKMKKLAIGLIGLLLICGAGIYFLLTNLDHLIKVNVEKYGSLATATNVQLDNVQLTFSTGEGVLTGLSVGNPKGFSTPKSFYLGSISVQLDKNSIRSDGPIVIRQIIIDKPQVTYELLNNGSSNLQTIQNNAVAYANSFQKGGGKAEGDPSKPGSGQSARKIIIDELVMRNGQVAISQELLKGKQLSAALPEIHLTDIGKASGGATAGQVAQQLLSAVTTDAAQAAVVELAKAKIGGLINMVPTSAIGGAAADTVGSKIKGIFGQ